VKDPTNLSTAYSRFRQLFESLLSVSWPEIGLDLEKMIDFRCRHSDSAYLCRWIPCPRAFVGFANVGDRAQHENSAHKAQFQCRDPSCGIWFPSRQAFRRHQRTYHVTEEDWIIPEFDEARQADIASVTKIDGANMVDYNKHWYELPNRDLIRRWATQLARSTPKEERQGIEQRMSKTFLQQLEDDVKPVAYHFRKLAQKEFMIKQAGALKDGYITATPRKRKLMKTWTQTSACTSKSSTNSMGQMLCLLPQSSEAMTRNTSRLTVTKSGFLRFLGHRPLLKLM
jgi:hypothetical protein